jgi:uroporphyrin-3 C-methyltransferase
MSDTKNDIQSSEDAEFEVELEMEDSEQAPKPKKRKGLVWLVLLVLVVALAAVAYALNRDWQADDESIEIEIDNGAKIEALDRRIDESNAALAALELRLGQISHPDYNAKIDGLRRDIEDQLRLLGSLPPRMSTLEDSVASLAGISAGARQTFLLAEAEYYLQIANAQLQLANNPHLASLALGMADERVTQLSDPGLTDVRRAISDELTALEVMKKPDIEGATLTLASLARVVESLPLAGTATPDESVLEDGTEQSGVSRAWDSVTDAFSGLVKITPPDQAKLALVSPNAEHFLRSNLALQLQAARLALLRGEQAIFEQTLDDTSALLTTYFDSSSVEVASALLTISEIRDNVFTADAPDISKSLRSLRQYRTLSETVE